MQLKKKINTYKQCRFLNTAKWEVKKKNVNSLGENRGDGETGVFLFHYSGSVRENTHTRV